MRTIDKRDICENIIHGGDFTTLGKDIQRGFFYNWNHKWEGG